MEFTKYEDFKNVFEKYIAEYNLEQYLLNLNEIREIYNQDLTEEEQNILIKRAIAEKIHEMYKYMKYLLEKNKSINVTAIKDEAEFLKKHIMDSIYITKYLSKLEDKVQNRKIRYIDIGTGGGFPLVPIKIFKEYDSYAMDSILKKLKVIKENQDISIIHSRAEVVAHDEYYREKFDLVTTRAVSSLKNVIAYMAGFVKVNGYAIIMRGKKEILTNEDKMQLKELLKEYGLRLEKIDNYILFGEERTNYILKKVTNLNKKLPITDARYYKENK